MSLLLAAGSVGTAAFVLTFLIDGATRRGYRPRYHPVSALALGRRGWVQATSFVVNGLLITVSALGIQQATGSVVLPVLVAVFGLSLVASGVFPMDPMRGYPPGTPDGTPRATSRRHQLHDWAGMVVFSSLPAAAVAAAFVLDGAVWVVGSALVAAVLAAGFVRFGSAWEDDDPQTGVVQRVVIVVGWAWLGLLCWSLIP